MSPKQISNRYQGSDIYDQWRRQDPSYPGLSGPLPSRTYANQKARENLSHDIRSALLAAFGPERGGYPRNDLQSYLFELVTKGQLDVVTPQAFRALAKRLKAGWAEATVQPSGGRGYRDHSYVIKEGDTLAGLSKKFYLSDHFAQYLSHQNRNTLSGENRPVHLGAELTPGLVLKIPDASGLQVPHRFIHAKSLNIQ